MVTLNSCLIWQIISLILPPNEYGCVYAWIRIAKWTCGRLTEDADFGKKKIIFSDKVHFDLGGYVNKQNCPIWGTENPHAYIEKTSYCLVRIVFQRPFFFENEQGEAVTINCDRYRAMFNEFLLTKIEEKDIQQDGATCHTAEATLDVFRNVFEDHIISRRVNIVWPPRSWDLKPLDYYLWGAVMDKCYTSRPETIDALKDNIREAIVEIQMHTIDNVLKNWTDRIGYCMANRGSHLIEIIFHY